MLEAVSLFIICLITHVLDCYIFSKLINEKIKINIKNIVIVLLFSVIDYYLSIISLSISKILISNIITILIFKLVYNKSMVKNILITLFTFVGYAMVEIIYAALLYFVLGKNSEFIFENNLGMLISNIIIFILYIMLFKIKRIVKLLGNSINWCDEKKYINIISDCILAMTVCTILMYPLSFNNVNKEYYIIIYTILVGIIVFVIGFFDEKSNNNQLNIKYGNLLDYVKDYETEVVEKGKVIHEHKNQLGVIDGMIPSNDKNLFELKKYVSKKLEKVSELDDNVWLEKLTNLPTGGTKGLVYLKIKKMLDNNISIYIEIDDDLKNKNEWKNVSSNLEDYTKILGVYLDNAIEASIDSKDKQIIIEFVDNNDTIEFILSNTYKGIINFNEIDKEKYSTKGKGRGYGLALVKDIIENNKYITQSREVNGKFYVQKLCIKK